jgi:hypothetical protein
MKSALVTLLVLLPNVARAEAPRTFEEKCTSTAASSNQGDANYDIHVSMSRTNASFPFDAI